VNFLQSAIFNWSRAATEPVCRELTSPFKIHALVSSLHTVWFHGRIKNRGVMLIFLGGSLQ